MKHKGISLDAPAQSGSSASPHRKAATAASFRLAKDRRRDRSLGGRLNHRASPFGDRS